MISVRCLGHIGTSVGAKELTLDYSILDASELIEKVRSVSREAQPGFTRYNTIVLVEDGEAFVPAGSSRVVRSGEKVALIPFSHGGWRTAAHVKAFLLPVGMRPNIAKQELASKNPEAVVQTAKAGDTENELFFEMLAAQTLRAQSSGALLAKKPEVDLILRLAGTTQISKAISRHGSRDGEAFVAIVAGKKNVVAPSGLASFEMKRKELSEEELDRIERAALLDAERA